MSCNRRNVMVPVAWHCWNQKPSTSINVLRQFFFLLLCLSLLHSVIVAVFSHSTFCVSSAFIYRMLTNGNKILTRSNSVVFSSVFFFSFSREKSAQNNQSSRAYERKLQLWIEIFRQTSYIRDMKWGRFFFRNEKKKSWHEQDNDVHIHDLLQLEYSEESRDLCHLSGKQC